MWFSSPQSNGRSIHMLGYFFDQPPTGEFRDWLEAIRAARRDRNRRLAARLQSLGIDVTLEEVERLGRSLAGRPHFARLLVQKGNDSGGLRSVSGRVRRGVRRTRRAAARRGHPAHSRCRRAALAGAPGSADEPSPGARERGEADVRYGAAGDRGVSQRSLAAGRATSGFCRSSSAGPVRQGSGHAPRA